MEDRLASGVRYLVREMSVSRDEFLRHNYPGGDMLLDAMLSQRYSWRKQDRIQLTESGYRRLRAENAENPGNSHD